MPPHTALYTPKWEEDVLGKSARRESPSVSESIRNKVRSCLTQDGWQVEEVVSLNNRWLFKFSSSDGVFVVGQPASVDDLLFVGMTMIPESPSRLALLPHSTRRAALHDIGRFVLSLGIHLTANDDLQEVRMESLLYFDGFTKDAFMRRVRDVVNSRMMIVSLLSLALSENASSEAFSTN